jgi:hypothetical protein
VGLEWLSLHRWILHNYRLEDQVVQMVPSTMEDIQRISPIAFEFRM